MAETPNHRQCYSRSVGKDKSLTQKDRRVASVGKVPEKWLVMGALAEVQSVSVGIASAQRPK